MTPYSDEHIKIKKLLEQISNKRAHIVIEHILENGFITTEQLKKKYGYHHPPRAARDVREAGIPLETFRTIDKVGRTIAAYRFGDLTKIRAGRLHGRQTFSKLFRDTLYTQANGKCAICLGLFAPRYLQVDHRIPYEVVGDSNEELKPEQFMLVCGSCNRIKSWSCEHCENWLNEKLPSTCLTCYWVNPKNYAHIALREIRRIDIVWEKEEVHLFEVLKQQAEQNNSPIPDFVKKVLAEFLTCNSNTPSQK